MYSEIQEDIDKGNCLLEWDSSKGKSPVPLIKDKYSNLRKMAKTMNFSIAYGKTAKGFAKDWVILINNHINIYLNILTYNIFYSN